MRNHTSNIFFIKLTFTCLNNDNNVTKKSIDLGMIKIPESTNIKDYLNSYVDNKSLHKQIWKEVEKFYKPDNVIIDFLKADISRSGIITAGSISYLKILYKL